MIHDPASFDLMRLRDELGDEEFVKQLHFLQQVGSTNDELKRLAAEGAPAGAVLIADCQVAGRGRLGRRWHSPPGIGLYMSVLFRPSAPIVEWTRWTLAAAVAAAQACRRCCNVPVTIKWPNDLTFEGRKLGGLLAETRAPISGPGELVLGLGLNVGSPPGGFPGLLSETATTLGAIGNAAISPRERIAASYLRELAEMDRALERGAWPAVAQRWLSLAPEAVDCRVLVAATADGLSYHGTTAGLDRSGALVVIRDEDRKRVAVRDACSIRPLESC